MMSVFDPTEYKKNSRANWNIVAHDYHDNWANGEVGPFKSTAEIVKVAEISKSDKVLDIACGTGAVSNHVSRLLGYDGMLVGIDMSRTALTIAKKSINSNYMNFFEMDAENMAFRIKFDKVLCQYGLMFFPDSQKVLKTIRKTLRNDGRLAVAVHGTADETPYFSSIMSPILKYLPDIRPKKAPTVHRFGNPDDLEQELSTAGFVNISIKKHIFIYQAGTFEEYWQDYMHSTANSIRSKIEDVQSNVMDSIKKESERNTSAYLKDGKIVFPWTVLIASAN